MCVCVCVWNSFPYSVVNAASVLDFDRKLDQVWKNLKLKFDHTAMLESKCHDHNDHLTREPNISNLELESHAQCVSDCVDVVFQRVLVVLVLVVLCEAEEDGGWCGGQCASCSPAYGEAEVGGTPYILLATQRLPGHCTAGLYSSPL